MVKISVRWSFANMAISISGIIFAIFGGTHEDGGGHHKEGGVDINAAVLGVGLVISVLLNCILVLGIWRGIGFQVGIFKTKEEILGNKQYVWENKQVRVVVKQEEESWINNRGDPREVK